MKIIQIQYFLTIAECKNITKAAEQLYISQPALSKQMTLLEEELGVKLLERRTNGIVLTEAGEVFVQDCRIIMDDLDQAVQKVSAFKKTKLDKLRIGCFDGAVIEDFLPELLSYLKEVDPNLPVKLSRNSVWENRKALNDGSIDMLIEMRLPSDTEEDRVRNSRECVLAHRRGAFIYSKSSPLAKKKNLNLSEFSKETMIVVDHSGERSLMKPSLYTIKMLGIEKPVIEKTENFMTLMSNIDLGLGYAALSAQVAESNPNLFAFPLPPELGLSIIAVWKKENKQIAELMKGFHAIE